MKNKGNKNSAPKPRLPLQGKLAFRYFTDELANVLTPMLAPPNHEIAQIRYGIEEVLTARDSIMIARSQKFQRYVMQSDFAPAHCCGIGVLEVLLSTHKKKPPRIDIIYVLPWARRQGIATQLLNAAQSDFPNLTVDSQLTADGAAFFGYTLPGSPSNLNTIEYCHLFINPRANKKTL